MLLFAKGITKRYPGVIALNSVDFELKAGEVMALVGQNGAGKSTLVKILGGVVPPDKGEIFVKGERVQIKNPKDAYNLGFSFIFQEGNLIRGFTGLENIFIGMSYPKRGLKIDWKKLYKKGEELKEKFKIEVELKKPVEELSPLERKKIEILKALFRNLNIFVLDEPTVNLSQKEINHLFDIIRDLKGHNIGIIYISHFIDEIFEIGDRVTILRDGKNVGTFSIDKVTKEEIINYEIGKEFKSKRKNIGDFKSSKEILCIKSLYTKSGLTDISFSLFEGEILGIFGLGGQGKTRLAMSLSGREKVTSGEIIKNGKRIKLKNPKDALDNGIILAPQDRSRYGIIESFSIAQNLTLPILDKIKKRYAIFSIIDRKSEYKESSYIIKELDIKAMGPYVKTGELSGGNKQKVVIGKGILKKADIFILDEPTQGLDVLAREEVHNYIDEFSKQGVSQIVISSDIDELLRLTHRIMIMKEGKIVKIVNTKEIKAKDILSIAYGGIL